MSPTGQAARSGSAVKLALALCLALALALAFYLWVGSSSGNPYRFERSSTRVSGFYNYQVDAYLHGRISLLRKPPAGLLALRNPYDPKANENYRTGVIGGTAWNDISLYKKRFYLYWGPTPALTSFLPFRVVGRNLPQNLAIALYCFVGLVFSVLLLLWLVRRYLPETPDWMLVAAAFCLAFANVAPFLMRRPDTYEAAVSAGYCFVMMGLYLIVSGALGPRVVPWRLLGGSLCLGLAAGARADLVVMGVVAAVVLILLIRRRQLESTSQKLQVALYLFGPFVAAGALLLLYNYLRFDSFTETGLTYGLFGHDPEKVDIGNFNYVAAALYYYGVAPPRFSLAFPFFFLPPPPHYPGSLPHRVELAGGILTAFPIVALGVVGVPFLRGRGLPSELGWLMGALGLVALAVMLILAYQVPNTTMRYEMDFATLFLLLAFLVWFVLAGPAHHVILRWAGGLLIALTVVMGAAFGMTGYFNALRNGNPGTFRSLERFFSPIPTLAARIAGNPLIVDVVTPPGGLTGPDANAKINYVTPKLDRPDIVVGEIPSVVEVASASAARVGLAANYVRAPHVPKGARVQLFVRVRGEPGVTSLAVTDRARPASIPVRLHRGLNEIHVRAAEFGSPARPRGQRAGGVVWIERLRLGGQL